MTRFSLILISSFILTGCIGFGTQKGAPVTHYGENKGAGSAGVHSIVPGDTLWSIAERFLGSGYEFTLLAKINNIKNPDLILVGNTLKITKKSRQGK